MPAHWTAFVTGLGRDGKAEVVIYTEQPGIPGAAGAKVCDHCSECTSRIRVGVLNPVGALVGDRVSVAHRPGALKRNLRNLLAVPLVGLLAGFAGGMILFHALTVNPTGTLLCAAGGLVWGIVAGILLQRRVRDTGLPSIIRVLESEPGANGVPFPSTCRQPEAEEGHA